MKNFVLLASNIKAAIIKAAKAEGLKVSPVSLNVNATEKDGVHSVTIGKGKQSADLFAGKWKTEKAFKRNAVTPEQIAVMVGVIRHW